MGPRAFSKPPVPYAAFSLHPRDEENPVLRQLPEPHIIVVAAVYGQDRTRFERRSDQNAGDIGSAEP
jgi:hypothetical protein